MPWVNKEKERAYKKAYYEATKEGRYQRTKHNHVKYRKNHRLQINKYERERHDPEKASKYWGRVKDKYNSEGRKETELLTEKYMIKHLKKLGYTETDIRNNPELINTYRIIIKTKRLWKQSATL